MQLVAALALMSLVLAGCAQKAGSDHVFKEPPPCNPERGRPISETTLKAVFAHHGIHLYRDDRCEVFRNPDAPPPDPDTPPRTPNAPQATLENCRDSMECDRVASAQGYILCEVNRGGPLKPRQRRATRVTRIKYEGDEETHLGIFNVSCAIYPDSPEQVDALAAAMRALRLASR